MNKGKTCVERCAFRELFRSDGRSQELDIVDDGGSDMEGCDRFTTDKTEVERQHLQPYY